MDNQNQQIMHFDGNEEFNDLGPLANLHLGAAGGPDEEDADYIQ